MFLLQTLANPMPAELGNWSPADLAAMTTPRLFSSYAMALAATQHEVDESNATNRLDDPDWQASDDLRLVDESGDNVAGYCWVFGAEHSDPNEEPWEGFVFAYCQPIAVEA